MDRNKIHKNDFFKSKGIVTQNISVLFYRYWNVDKKLHRYGRYETNALYNYFDPSTASLSIAKELYAMGE